MTEAISSAVKEAKKAKKVNQFHWSGRFTKKGNYKLKTLVIPFS